MGYKQACNEKVPYGTKKTMFVYTFYMAESCEKNDFQFGLCFTEVVQAKKDNYLSILEYTLLLPDEMFLERFVLTDIHIMTKISTLPISLAGLNCYRRFVYRLSRTNRARRLIDLFHFKAVLPTLLMYFA